MAMTKKEREYVESLERKLRIQAALRWTDIVEKDIPVPKLDGKCTSGYVFNAHTKTVTLAWSSSVFHGIGYASRKDGYGAAQQGISIYSTRLLALQGLRNAIETMAATDLAKIDMMIEEERATQQANTEQSE